MNYTQTPPTLPISVPPPSLTLLLIPPNLCFHHIFKFYFTFNMCRCLCGSRYVRMSADAHRRQKRRSDPRKLQLQTAVSPLLWYWELNLGSLQEQCSFLTSKPLLQPSPVLSFFFTIQLQTTLTLSSPLPYLSDSLILLSMSRLDCYSSENIALIKALLHKSE